MVSSLKRKFGGQFCTVVNPLDIDISGTANGNVVYEDLNILAHEPLEMTLASNSLLPANNMISSETSVSLQHMASMDSTLSNSQGKETQLPPLEHMIQNEPLHIDSTMLRRSSRCNKYDGFRVPLPSDHKQTASKVKPRKQPFVQCSSTATAPSALGDGKAKHDIPPPTAITTMQNIGTNMCGTPSST